MSSSELSAALRRRLGHAGDEEGSSIIEFVVLTAVLLVPVVYLIVAVSSLQAASYASVGAADQAAKMHATAENPEDSASRAEAAVSAALADYDIDASQAEISIDCPAGSCEDDGDLVSVTVDVTVPVPLLSSLGSWDPTLATVSSNSVQVRAQ